MCRKHGLVSDESLSYKQNVIHHIKGLQNDLQRCSRCYDFVRRLWRLRARLSLALFPIRTALGRSKSGTQGTVELIRALTDKVLERRGIVLCAQEKIPRSKNDRGILGCFKKKQSPG